MKRRLMMLGLVGVACAAVSGCDHNDSTEVLDIIVFVTDVVFTILYLFL